MNPLDRCAQYQLNGQCGAPCKAGFSCVPLGTHPPACVNLSCPNGYRKDPLTEMCRKIVSSRSNGQTTLFQSDSVFVTRECTMSDSKRTLYEFSKELEPLNATFRIVNPTALNVRIKEKHFELSEGPVYMLKLAKPIKQKLDIQIETTFSNPESTHIYNTFVFIR